MKLLSRKQFKDVEEEQVTLQPEEPEDMVSGDVPAACVWY